MNEMRRSAKQRVKIGLLGITERLDRLCNTASGVAPPRTLYHQYGGGNFFDAGLEFFRILLNECGLERSSSILDVGCGAGRIATPLQFYLSADGRYDGFDIMPDGIKYCAENVTPVFPNFHFQKADVHNSFYNPSGSQQPENYIFPYPDSSFDIVLSTSVMTHLPPIAATRYVAETARVLKPSGVSMHTFFVLDEFSKQQIDAGMAWYDFRHDMGGFLTTNPSAIEEAIALPVDMVQRAYAHAGMSCDIKRGSWCRWEPALTGQDVVLGRHLPRGDAHPQMSSED